MNHVSVAIAPVGTWDIRQIVISGKRNQLSRLLLQLFERGATAARAVNHTQIILILDESGYSVRKHACLACKSFGIKLNYTKIAHRTS